MSGPSAWAVERSLAAWHRVCQSLLTDPDLIADEAVIAAALAAENERHPLDLLDRLIDAAVWTRLRAEEADQLAKDMTARRDRYRTRFDLMRDTIESLQEILGVPKRRAKFGQTYYGGPTQSVLITDIDRLPDEVFPPRRKQEPSRTLIRETLERGEPIEGAVLSNPHRPLVIRKL